MSSLPSFFLASTAFHDLRVTLHDPDVIRQMRKVFRMQSGDTFIALDGAGHECACVIDHIDHTEVRAFIAERKPNTRETAVPIMLYPSLIRRERFAVILEKCTELGVLAFVPVDATRSPYHDMSPNLRARWEHIIREAAEVARRGLLPKLAPVASLADALTNIPEHEQVIAFSTAQENIKKASDIVGIVKRATRVHLFLGPEGDYTEEEYALLQTRGALPLSLGARIVRSETAAIAAVTLFTSLQ